MTVGIAAIAQGESGDEVIVSADRLVTVGRRGGVEYEDTSSKIEKIAERDGLTVVGVGSGSTTYIDQIMRVSREYFEQVSEVESASFAANLVNQAYQQVIRQTIENSVLQPLGFTLADLKDDDVRIPNQMQHTIMERSRDKREAIRDNVRIIVAAVGSDGAVIHVLAGGDFSNFTDTGYSVIGSGSNSAQLTFTRRRYDSEAGVREGIFTVLEAKDQAEERQGVGQRMDIVRVSSEGLFEFGNEEKETLRDLLFDIDRREQMARESVMDGWDAPF